MLDIRFIREYPDRVVAGAKKKKTDVDTGRILKLDGRRREIINKVEELKAGRNRASTEIAKKKMAGEPAEEAIAAMRNLGAEISGFDSELRETESSLNDLLIRIPNLPHESVPEGEDESANEVVRQWGETVEPEFEVLPHWEIGEKLGILDLQAAARISGSGFYMLVGAGARLQRALINYMLEMHVKDGFTEIYAPFIVNSDSMFGTGQLPKMADDMYRITGDDDLWLIPTAEVPLTNIFKKQILDYKNLPTAMVAHSPCFRREAGAAGKDTRGMMRVHQFDKVELVRIVRPESSYDELELLTAQAEKVLQGLKIPYRVCVLAGGDLSFASAKTYDLELWAAGIKKYLEISSISNFEDFQARRMNCRFRDEEKKIIFPHTLNGSGLALARLIPAILENYQNADGSVTVPDVLRPYMGGIERIG